MPPPLFIFNFFLRMETNFLTVMKPDEKVACPLFSVNTPVEICNFMNDEGNK